MLNDYKESQFVAVDILMREIENNQIGHAYLFDENNNAHAFDIVMAFVKEILSYGLKNKEKEVLLQRINDGNYPEIKIIEPDGMLIKKRQILDLQQEFSMAAVEGKKRIYIIRDADKMRNETSNSMLKFLEEPANDIVAILMTNNFNSMLTTIISRCQLIRLSNNDIMYNDGEIDDTAFNFIKCLEFDGIKTIMREKELLFDSISVKDRENMTLFFDKLIDVYYDIVKIIDGKKEIRFVKYIDKLNEIASNNSIDEILYKIQFLLDAKENIKSNVNMNLLIDSVIVNIGGAK